MTRASCAGVAALLALAACTLNFPVREPEPSDILYDVDPPLRETAISLLDERSSDGRTFISGSVKVTLEVDGEPLDAPQFLATSLEEELRSRGLPLDVRNVDAGAPRLRLKTFRMQTQRTNAYTPFFTLTFLKVDLESARGTKRIGVFVTRGRVPLWSFGEVVEPTLNEPLSLAVKELATKLASELYSYRASDATVKELAARLAGPRTESSFLDVYDLGFTNNPRAIDTLVPLSSDGQEYIRAAAIASLGTLRATSQLALLKAIYRNPDSSWQDRCLAAKSIGDLGTQEAQDFLAQELPNVPRDKEGSFVAQVIELYH